MKSFQISEDILPLGEFKTHASRILKKLRTENRPLIITLNGKPAAVLINPAEFDRMNEQRRFLQAVQEGLADAEAGKVLEDDEMSRELEAEFGSL